MFQIELTYCCGQENLVTGILGEGFSTKTLLREQNFVPSLKDRIFSHMEDSYGTVLYKASRRSK